MMGIDEAGRGPVLGPMVYGACFCPKSYAKSLSEKGYADSKTLTAKEREMLFDAIKEDEHVGHLVRIISPEELSAKMLRREKISLNEISHNAAIELISKVIEQGYNLAEVYLDTVGDPQKYAEKIMKIFSNLKVTVAKKADSLYPVVSAASICAKVVRDDNLENWQFKELGVEFSRDWGCGYPSDPKTKNWMERHFNHVFGFPSLVRFSWLTCRRFIEANGIKLLWEDDEESDSSQMNISNFFKNSSSSIIETESSKSIPSTARSWYFQKTQMRSLSQFP